MRKILTLSLLLLVGYLFFASTQVSAEALIPGVNCGKIDDGATQCCIDPNDIPSEEPGLLERAARIVGAETIENFYKSRRILHNSVNELKKDNELNSLCLAGGEADFLTDQNGTVTGCQCVPQIGEAASQVIEDRMCGKYFETTTSNEESEKNKCIKCAQSFGYWSSIGCVPLNISQFVSGFVLNIGIGIGGLAALLCLIINSLRLQMSRGDSAKLQKVRENVTSCILGLVLILFSIVILRLADISILGGLIGG